MKVVLVTGGFDPLHSGHIEYFKAAKKLGDKLIVGVNSDSWLERKKGRAFMPQNERINVVSELSSVDAVYSFDDTDGSSRMFIWNMRTEYPDADIIFANGGDRTANNIPETDIQDTRLEFVFGVGGEEKINSSSKILKSWTAENTLRPWGEYQILYEKTGTKVKELIIKPHQSLSMQRHKLRSEYWFVVNGKCLVETEYTSMIVYSHDEMIKIPTNSWHKLSNPFEEPCCIIEIQYGKDCTEEDIERKN